MIPGDVVVKELIVENNAILTIEGDLTLQRNASTTLDGGNAVQVEGDAVLDGVLVLQLDEVPLGPVQVIQADNITGDFSSINANVAGLRSCEQVNAATDTAASSASSYSVLVTVDKSACGGGLSIGAIVGIALGGCLVVAALLVALVVYCSRRKNRAMGDATRARIARRREQEAESMRDRIVMENKNQE